MTIRARSTPNIALIKYWGNRNEELRMPAADSLSMTLDSPCVEVAVTTSTIFNVQSFEPDGTEINLDNKAVRRLEKHFRLVKQLLGDKLPESVSIEIRSEIPRSIGLASSAAVFSALAEAYCGFLPDISRRDISVAARLGSGSASRSIFGGFSAMISGAGEKFDSSYAQEITDENHWLLYDVVIVPSSQHKETGSTEGHALAKTSPLFEERMRALPARQRKCIDAVLARDFIALQQVAEEDCMDMHNVMRTSTPSLNYLSAETLRIVEEIKKLRSVNRLPVLYTMDAGPTVHLICEEDALDVVRKFAELQKGTQIFVTKIGAGSHLV